MAVYRPHGQARRLLLVLMVVLAAVLLLLASSTATAYVLPALPSGSVRSAGSTAVSSPPSIKSPLWGARRRSQEPTTRHKAAAATAVPLSGAVTGPYTPGRVVEGQYLQGMDRYRWRTLPEIFETLAALAPQQVAVEDPIHNPAAKLTYGELNERISQLAAFLQHRGLRAGQCVSIFSENSHRWLVADQAVLRAGGCNAVRGVKAPVGELQYIYSNSESVAAIVETADQIPSLLSGKGLSSRGVLPRFILVLFPGDNTGREIQDSTGSKTEVVTYEEALAQVAAEVLPLRAVPRDVRSVATLVYTSGTTNQPKGVVLRHSNLLHQVNHNTFSDTREAERNPRVGDKLVSVLPCWHIFERTAEYWMYSKGIHVVYSNVKNFKTDLAKHKPQFIVAVPRLFETIYRGVQQKFATEKGVKRALIGLFTKVSMAHVRLWRLARGLVIRDRAPNPLQRLVALLMSVLLAPLRAAGDKLVWSKVRAGLGGRIKVMVAGGSSMPLVLEDFFDMIRTPVIVGYGMTETSPVITNRVVESNLAGSVGRPARDTQVKIVHLETGQRLPIGQSGVVMMKGPQAMSGYKANAEASKKAFDAEGFLDTGDLGRINPGTGHLIITGRAKDTIVLSNGKNVEPQPIEDAVCAKAKLVDQIMCVGQDRKVLGALVVPNLRQLARAGLVARAEADRWQEILGGQVLVSGIQGSREELREMEARLQGDKAVRKALLADIAAAMGKDFQDFERVGEVGIVLEPFNMANGYLTQTLKVKRNMVYTAFANKIEQMW